MKKIAIDCHTLEIKNWAGKEQFLFFLLQELARIDRYNNYILYFRRKVFDNGYFPKNFKIINKNLPTPIWQFYILWNLFIEKISILFIPCTYLLPALNFIKTTVTAIHDLTTFLPHIRGTHKIMTRLREKLVLGLAIRNSERIIAVSNNTKNDLIKLFKVKPDKVSVIYEAAHPRFRVMNNVDKISNILSKYKIPDKFILSVGTIEPRKNLIRLFEAFRSLIKDYKIEYKLILIGKKGWYFDEIFKKVRELDLEKYIIFVGYIPDEDLPYFYNAAACFVYPSLYEGFGLPVIEAMACGCPVITSNISSLPEVAGDAAILINPYNIKEISGTIYKVLIDDNRREEMKQKGLKQVKKFSWANTAKQLLSILNSQYD